MNYKLTGIDGIWDFAAQKNPNTAGCPLNQYNLLKVKISWNFHQDLAI